MFYFKANRKIREILIRENGFSRTELTISEGEVISYGVKNIFLINQLIFEFRYLSKSKDPLVFTEIT